MVGYRTLLAFFLIFSLAEGLASNSSTTSDSHDKMPMASDSLSIHLSASFQSRHIWRGSLTCSAWNVQPTLNLSKRNFLLGLWGAYTVDNSYSEVNLYASYTVGRFSLALLDYYCPNETQKFNRLFDFNRQTTRHTLDLTLSYNGSSRFPLWIMASTLLWGDDNNPGTGKKRYSTYLEAGYTWSPGSSWEFEFLVGATPHSSYYASGANVVNVGFGAKQSLTLGNAFKLPIFVKLLANPYEENLYLVFGAILGK